MPWREESGVRFCQSDSWAPPVSLLRAASREQTANQRPDKLSLPFVWSLPLVPGLAIGWSTLFVFRLSSLALIRLVSTHSLVSHHPQVTLSVEVSIDFQSGLPSVGSHLLSATVSLQRPFPQTGSSNHQPQAPLSCFDKTNHHNLSLSTSHPPLVCVVDLLGDSPWFLD